LTKTNPIKRFLYPRTIAVPVVLGVVLVVDDRDIVRAAAAKDRDGAVGEVVCDIVDESLLKLVAKKGQKGKEIVE